jgi:hypothetical protein
LPIRKDVLNFGELAELWSRELDGIRSTSEIEDELLASFWRGEIEARYEGAARNVDRTAMLRILNLNREHPGFRLVEDRLRPTFVREADGGITLNVPPPQIVLPCDPKLWTKDLLGAAFAALADLTLGDFGPAVMPLLAALAVTKDGFARFCHEQGCSRPRFWFQQESASERKARYQRELTKWLRQLARERKTKSKSAYFEDAKDLLPGLSRKVFDSCWAKIMPASWKQSGPATGPGGTNRRATS